ncbi:MAG: DUF2489 domain-containing protein [Pseudomonadales bacterium]|nr:DUF2489 domain-containing protein [Pseudomonadales bacterium]NRA15384.1 DUF2489 domain-containing protein [Oceanospirillaceae bacterium]
MIYFAIFSGCLFILALSFYIYRTLKTASAQKSRQQTIIQQHIAQHDERQEYVSSSIDIIVKALACGQIEVVEAGIRLKVLIDQLRPNIAENSFPMIELIFAETGHIPKLKEWKALDKKQRKEYTRKMNKVEQQHGDQLKEEVQRLGELMVQRK